MIDIKSLEISELEKFILEIGEAKFRAKQIYEWLHKKLVLNFDEMSNLSLSLKGKLKNLAHITSIKEELVRISKLDDTRKYLFELEDGNIIESVLMKYKHGNSVCISSQVGCRMGCTFCASTIDGLVRNLTAAEMLDQVYSIQKSLGERISNIVIMGSGEPMDNYDNIVKFVRLITSLDGLNISQRNITISTCGIVPRMRKLAEEGLQVTLALSLHAPNDEIRKSIMPVDHTWPLEELMKSLDDYTAKTNKKMYKTIMQDYV